MPNSRAPGPLQRRRRVDHSFSDGVPVSNGRSVSRPLAGRAAFSGVLVGVLITATASIMGGEIHRAVATRNQLASPPLVKSSQASLAQTYCWMKSLRAEVPQGDTVFVGSGTYASQRLAEAAVLWARLVDNEQSAHWIVTLVPASTCDGETVVATARQ